MPTAFEKQVSSFFFVLNKFCISSGNVSSLVNLIKIILNVS